MSNFDSGFEYIFDFSKDECLKEEKEMDNKIFNFLKSVINGKKSDMSIGAAVVKVAEFVIIKKYLKNIALENSFIMRIIKLPGSPIVFIKLRVKP